MLAASVLKTAFPVVARCSGLGAAMAMRYRGNGTIFMLHSVVEDGTNYPDHSLRCPVGRLARALRWLKRNGVEFVTLDQMVERLSVHTGRPFAAFTFDDGFADTLTHALPVMEEFDAPMTVYVATGMITGEMDAWWLGLADLIRRKDRIELPDFGGPLDCSDSANKKRTFVAIEKRIHENYDLLSGVRDAIAGAGIDCSALVTQEALTADKLRQLSRHPLVTIGGHGDTHINLAQADAAIVECELISNRSFLEGIIDKPVMHFAYPFGNAHACGEREAEIARATGFRTAVTTRCGSVFPQHADNLYALPREVLSADDTSSSLSCKLNGVYRAVHSRFGDPVALM